MILRIKSAIFLFVEFKHEDIVRSLWDNFKHTNILIIGVPEQKREQEIVNCIWKNNDSKRPLLGGGNRHTSAGSSESPKQDEPKEAHTKTA